MYIYVLWNNVNNGPTPLDMLSHPVCGARGGVGGVGWHVCHLHLAFCSTCWLFFFFVGHKVAICMIFAFMRVI